MSEATDRIDSEWIALSAFRGLTQIAAKGDASKSTYENALELGGELYPELLGPGTSVLRRYRESDTTKEYRQRANLHSIRSGNQVDPGALVRVDLEELRELLSIAKRNKANRSEVDQLKKRLVRLEVADDELNPTKHTEHQLIFRDAYVADRMLPMINSGKAHRDFELGDGDILRLRVLHPDKPEQVCGADVIYERHIPDSDKASIVAVQYKIWEDKKLSLQDQRLSKQLSRLRKFACRNSICERNPDDHPYRFPCCAAFLRPTDKLQNPDQKFISSGEHLPICRIDECKKLSAKSAASLHYDNIREVSLNNEAFEYLFNRGKIGSKALSYDELTRLYATYMIETAKHNVVIHAQEFRR